jgi:anion-transporting  ArsA/GET3 family ATPase
MLDQKRAFDEVVERYARDPVARQRILDNRIYQQISASLTGSHEYAAMAKLHQIARERDYELIVVDTPPTAHALDFLDAPQKVAGAIESPALEWFAAPLKKTGSFSLKMVGVGGAFVLKRIAKFVGSNFLEDMARFFVEFNDVLGGFRERAKEVFDLLRGKEVGFVIVSAPEPSTVDEALFFHERLVEQQMPMGAFVVNRVHEDGPDPPSTAELVERLSARAESHGYAPAELARSAEALLAAYRDMDILAEADHLQLARLKRVAGDMPVVTVPLLDSDVHDVEALGTLGRYLT